MKKLFLILLAPILMATQCENDNIILRTDYAIQNNSSIDLIFVTESNNQELIETQSNLIIGSSFNSDGALTPSENDAFETLKLFKLDDENNLVLAYQQEQILNELWIESDPLNADFVYTLVITDDLIIEP